MHPNAQLIEKFYSSFREKDAAGMIACYHPDVAFADAVFALKGKEAGAMWHMFCEGGRDLAVTFGDIQADDTRGQAHWEATYTFSATGRKVHNVPESSSISMTEAPMKNPTLSITVFGVYLLATGLGFVMIPNLLLPLFGFPATTEVWVRIVGLLSAILGMYFLYLARPDQRRFMLATVYARLIFFTGVTAFALLSFGSPILIAFGLIDLAGAAWTWLALRATQ